MRQFLFAAAAVTLAVIPCFGQSASPYAPNSLFTVPNASAAPIIRAGDDKVPNEFIVVLRDDVLPDAVTTIASQAVSASGGQVAKVWQSAVKGFFARMTDAQAAALTSNPLVKYVEENAKWYLSANHQTNINPITCDPRTGSCPPVVDDRLWHLDRADQNGPSPNDSYSYCTDGSEVTVYVVDTGVSKFHNEFGPRDRAYSQGRIQAGISCPLTIPAWVLPYPRQEPTTIWNATLID